MIVVVILGLIAGAVAVAVFPQDAKAKARMAHVSAAALRSAADAWRSEHGAASCPTPTQLQEEKLVDRGSHLEDPWGTPFKIVCNQEETSVVSLGPDRKEGADDIVEPPMVAARE
jgi:general secretion pathway protein G